MALLKTIRMKLECVFCPSLYIITRFDELANSIPKTRTSKTKMNICFVRPATRDPTSTSSGTSRLTVASDASALANALQTALNNRAAPTRSQSQPVDLAIPPSTQQTHQPHAWHSQPAAFRRGEFRSG